MGGCESMLFSVKIHFILDPRYFKKASKKLRLNKSISIKLICKEIKSSLISSYSKKNYRILIRFRGKVYNSKSENITLFELNAQNKEKMTVVVVPIERHKNSANIKISCCVDEQHCILLQPGFTISQLKEEILKAKSCCQDTDFKVIYKDLELGNDDNCPSLGEDLIYAVFGGRNSESMLSP